MSDKLFYFLWVTIVWLLITGFIVWNWIDGIKEKVEWDNFVRAGGCIAIDQMGNCYNAEEYQKTLESEKKIEVEEKLAEFNLQLDGAEKNLLQGLFK